MKTHLRTSCCVLTAAVAALVLPSDAQSQGIRYTEETHVEFAGMMGTMMSAFGDQDPMETTTWMQDGLLRTDDGTTSTIVNLAEGSYTFIDHETRTFFRATFEEMMAGLENMADGTLQGAPPAGDEAPAEDEMPPEEEEPRVEAEFDFDADRTGERRTFGDYEAERVILTMTVEFLAEDEEGDMQEAGDMVMVNDMWISAEFPTGAEFLEGEGAEWVEDMQASSEDTMGRIMEANPQVGVAMERMQEEMEGLEGTTLESLAYVVLVTPGRELDRDAVLALNEQPLSEGLGSVVGDAAGAAARDAAADAARSAVGRIGGLFGRRNDEEEEPEPEVPAQSVLTRATTRITGVETGLFPAEVFQVDPSYTEQRPAWMGGGD
ncbi:MAG: hypothetical protein KJO11_00020 [Gemmatimonadetes bacterium]|nr:hypothetical protein [Gemmatimonadota bacterium]